MYTQDFDYKALAESFKEQVKDLLPQEFNEKQKEYIINIIYEYTTITGGQLEEVQEIKLNNEDALLFIQTIAELTFHKSIDLFNTGMEEVLIDKVLQTVAFSAFEELKHIYMCEKRPDASEIFDSLLEKADIEYSKCLVNMKQNKLISQEIYEKAVGNNTNNKANEYFSEAENNYGYSKEDSLSRIELYKKADEAGYENKYEIYDKLMVEYRALQNEEQEKYYYNKKLEQNEAQTYFDKAQELLLAQLDRNEGIDYLIKADNAGYKNKVELYKEIISNSQNDEIVKAYTNKLIEHSPAAGYYQKALKYEYNNPEKAITFFLEALDNGYKPKCAIYQSIFFCYKSLKNEEKAFEILDKLTEADAYYGYTYKIDYLKELDRNEEVIECLKEALKDEKAQLNEYYLDNLIQYYQELGNKDMIEQINEIYFKQNPYSAYKQQAFEAIRNGEYETALNSYKKALENYKGEPEVEANDKFELYQNIRLCNILLKDKENANAITEEFKEYIAEHVKEVYSTKEDMYKVYGIDDNLQLYHSLSVLGDEPSYNGNYEAAINTYLTILEIIKEDYGNEYSEDIKEFIYITNYKISKAYKENGNIDKSFFYIGQNILLLPHRGYIDKGELLIKDQNYKEALEVLLKAETYEENNKNLTLLEYIIDSYYALNDIDSALITAGKILKIDEYTGYIKLADLWYEKGDLEMSLKNLLDAEKISDMDYQKIEIYKKLIQVSNLNKKEDITNIYTEKLIDLDKNIGYLYKGLVYYKQQQYKDALKWFEESEKYPNCIIEPERYYEFIDASIEAELYDKAIEYSEKIIDLGDVTGFILKSRTLGTKCDFHEAYKQLLLGIKHGFKDEKVIEKYKNSIKNVLDEQTMIEIEKEIEDN